MEAYETASFLALASNSCCGDRCPYRSQCTGRSDTCKMKELALLLRAQQGRIETLETMVAGLRDILNGLVDYISGLEKVITKYHNMVSGFKAGMSPNNLANKHKARPIKSKYYGRRGKKIDPVEMDGDPRYEQPQPRTTPPENPMVVI